MTSISTDQAQAEMILASDVFGRNGRLLATQGTVISEQHLLAFRTWGIREIEIVSDDNNETGIKTVGDAISAEQLKETMEQIQPRFCLNNLSHPLIADLMRLCAIRRISADEN